jgi:hypothetical protein
MIAAVSLDWLYLLQSVIYKTINPKRCAHKSPPAFGVTLDSTYKRLMSDFSHKAPKE